MNKIYYQNQNILKQQINMLQITTQHLNDSLTENQFLFKRYVLCKKLSLDNVDDIIINNYLYSELNIAQIKNYAIKQKLIYLNVSNNNNDNDNDNDNKIDSFNYHHIPLAKLKKNKSLNKYYQIPLVVISENILDSIKACEILVKKDFFCVINCSESFLKW